MNKTQYYTIQEMHCAGCAVSIDLELEETNGIISSSTSYPKAQSVVVFDPDKITSEQIITIIQKTGYQAKEMQNG